MTTNIDRAAEVIGLYVHPDFAEDAAQALADAGLLARELRKVAAEVATIGPVEVVEGE